eukprot:Rhum_TRINITY_DN8859_c0_g2::Rhum_TRINITY_DN8859_c0_g2_i1::g.30214::m.30214
MKEVEVWVHKDDFGMVGMVYTGCRVDAVTPGSGAHAAGVEKGMRILSVNGRVVGGTNEVAGSLAAAPARFALRVGIPMEFKSLDAPQDVEEYQRAIEHPPPPPLQPMPVVLSQHQQHHHHHHQQRPTHPPASATAADHRNLSPTRAGGAAYSTPPPRQQQHQPPAQPPQHLPLPAPSADMDLRRVHALQMLEEKKRYEALASRLDNIERKMEDSEHKRQAERDAAGRAGDDAAAGREEVAALAARVEALDAREEAQAAAMAELQSRLDDACARAARAEEAAEEAGRALDVEREQRTRHLAELQVAVVDVQGSCTLQQPQSQQQQLFSHQTSMHQQQQLRSHQSHPQQQSQHSVQQQQQQPHSQHSRHTQLQQPPSAATTAMWGAGGDAAAADDDAPPPAPTAENSVCGARSQPQQQQQSGHHVSVALSGQLQLELEQQQQAQQAQHDAVQREIHTLKSQLGELLVYKSKTERQQQARSSDGVVVVGADVATQLSRVHGRVDRNEQRLDDSVEAIDNVNRGLKQLKHVVDGLQYAHSSTGGRQSPAPPTSFPPADPAGGHYHSLTLLPRSAADHYDDRPQVPNVSPRRGGGGGGGGGG